MNGADRRICVVRLSMYDHTATRASMRRKPVAGHALRQWMQKRPRLVSGPLAAQLLVSPRFETNNEARTKVATAATADTIRNAALSETSACSPSCRQDLKCPRCDGAGQPAVSHSRRPAVCFCRTKCAVACPAGSCPCRTGPGGTSRQSLCLEPERCTTVPSLGTARTATSGQHTTRELLQCFKVLAALARYPGLE